MIKRLLAILVSVLPLATNAQLAVGEWELYNAYDGVMNHSNHYNDSPFTGYQLVETPGFVYYVSQNCLFSYDKETQETYSFSAINKLSDSTVKGIWYNDKGKYLLVAYDTGNIDLIYEDGKIVNLPDIKDATLTSTKNINDVAFNDNKIYIATSFGLVIYDDQRHFVIDSGIYKFSILSVAIVNGNIVIYSSDANSPKQYFVCSIPVGSRINSFNSYKLYPWSDGWISYANCLRALDGNKLIVRAYDSSTKLFALAQLEFDFAKSTVKKTWLYSKAIGYPALLKDGRYFVKGDNEILYISPDGSIEKASLASPLPDQAIAMYDGPTSVWTANSEGIACYDITASPVTIKNDYSHLNLINLKKANKLKFSPTNRLYINQMTISHVYGTSSWWLQRSSILDDGNFTDATATNVKNLNSSGPAYQLGENIIRDVCDVVEDPNDPDTYYVGTVWEGVFKLTKNENGQYVETAHYFTNNAPYEVYSGLVLVPALAFDKFGNLWTLNGKVSASSSDMPVKILPAAALSKSSVTASDWKVLPIADFGSSFDSRILVCQHSNMIFILDSAYGTRLLAYDTKGTASFSDDTYYVWEKWVDQDGKQFGQGRATSIIEGTDGKIWIGAENGIVEISNPTEATNPNMVFNRLKVPRRDGSGFADYLLDTQQVLSLAVDGANRKWAGTASSGLFYISPSGDEIIETYDTDNSVLTNNDIYAIACDPLSNDVYVGTGDGVYRYNGKVAPGADDYSNVYAFPNPVRPDYTGWITIKGLIDGSRVKIADASGSVFLDTVSEGGMITWDGCNRNGERVRTGVYYVYASKSGDGIDTQGAVTKILVVN